MKPILVTQRLSQAREYPEERECLDVRWADFLRQCGLLPIALPVNGDIDAYLRRFEPAGVVLTGGNDLECCAPGDHASRKRDVFEHALIEASLRERLPVLGVCRGMQMLGRFFGLRLSPVAGHVAVSHPITVRKDSLFAGFYQDGTAVNSYHAFAVDGDGGGLAACAWSLPGRCMEAMSSPDNRVIGIMWHPERETPFSRRDISLFRTFFRQE